MPIFDRNLSKTSKLERIEKAKLKSQESKKKNVKKKIDEHFQKLPVKERDKMEMEEMKERRNELKTIKQELWKYRGKERNILTKRKGENRKLRDRMEKIIEINKKLKEEEAVEQARKMELEKKKEIMRKQKKLEEIKILEKICLPVVIGNGSNLKK